jgi:hypothetical protein
MNRWGKSLDAYKAVASVPVSVPSSAIKKVVKWNKWAGYIKHTLPDKAELKRNLEGIKSSSIDPEEYYSNLAYQEFRAEEAHIARAEAELKAHKAKKAKLAAAASVGGGGAAVAAAEEGGEHLPKITARKAGRIRYPDELKAEIKHIRAEGKKAGLTPQEIEEQHHNAVTRFREGVKRKASDEKRAVKAKAKAEKDAKAKEAREAKARAREARLAGALHRPAGRHPVALHRPAGRHPVASDPGPAVGGGGAITAASERGPASVFTAASEPGPAIAEVVEEDHIPKPREVRALPKDKLLELAAELGVSKETKGGSERSLKAITDNVIADLAKIRKEQKKSGGESSDEE